ncbi:DUF6199 family natural product biosynthesis protein [Paenibacillus humicola]|uniref:DUF6199 family natural product biosynthesis protein n=1 Tax=Paenibacillus humicola TaxID=3110540 RepID=UPI00308424D1
MGALAVFLIFAGLFNLLAPRAAWHGSIGWKPRQAKPSEAYLALHRIGGGIARLLAPSTQHPAPSKFIHAPQQYAKKLVIAKQFRYAGYISD